MKKYTAYSNSWAYCALDLEHSTALTEDEQKFANPSYKNERMANFKPKDVYFHGKLREALVDSSLFASAAVDKAMKNVEPDEIPQELQDAYYEMMRSAVKLRL